MHAKNQIGHWAKFGAKSKCFPQILFSGLRDFTQHLTSGELYFDSFSRRMHLDVDCMRVCSEKPYRASLTGPVITGRFEKQAPGLWRAARLEVTLFLYRPPWFCRANQVIKMLTSYIYMILKQWGLYESKVTPSLAAIRKPGHWADNCKMVYCSTKKKHSWLTFLIKLL